MIIDESLNSNEELATWQTRDKRISKALIWIYIINFLIIFAVSLITAIVVIFVRKRKDCFVVTALICYIISSAVILSIHIYLFFVD